MIGQPGLGAGAEILVKGFPEQTLFLAGRLVLGQWGVYCLPGAGRLRGFDLQDDRAWAAVLPRMRPGRVYPFSISKPKRGRLLHYHVGLFLPDEKGGVWLYQSTSTGQAYRAEMTSRRGMKRFKEAFRKTRTGVKKILIVETDIPRTGMMKHEQQKNLQEATD